MSKDIYDKLVAKIQDEIERSRPLEPIRLNPEGDELVEIPPSAQNGNYLVGHTGDETPIREPNPGDWTQVGIHRYCEGCIYRRRGTKELDTMICNVCFLRVSISREVTTYRQLREDLDTRM